MLSFIGSGSAFNTELGNNSAFYKEGDKLILIDCGSSVFKRIKETNLLECIKDIHVLITHTHADHIGSLADLILYAYYSHGKMGEKNITIYSPWEQSINLLLEVNGCIINTHYDMVYTPLSEESEIIGTNIAFQPESVPHVAEIDACSFELGINGKSIYYSGDTNDIDEITLERLHLGHFDYFYIDTCKADYEGNVHLSLKKLYSLVDTEYRNYVWCMHLDAVSLREDAELLGFNVVNNI